MSSAKRYKKITAASSALTKNLLNVSNAELGFKHQQYLGERERSLYGGIGASVANVLGILDERKKNKVFDEYKDIAINLPGIKSQTEEYQPLGKFGELLHFNPKTNTKYFSKETGKELSDSILYGIGRYELFNPGVSAYSIYEEGGG